MVSLSNHEGLARAFGVRRFMVRQAHHEAFSVFSVSLRGPSAAFAIRPLAPALGCFLGNAGFSQAIDRQLDVGGLEAELSMLDHRLLEIESGIELEQPGHGDARILGVAELAV